LVLTSFYGNAILESVYAFAFSGSSMFVAGDLFDDQIHEADIAQPRNFIRNMCMPPPFGSTSAATYAEIAKSGLFPTKWNPKSVVLRDRFSSVSKPE